MTSPRIGIVGGAGQMGKWFERFFDEAGLETVISDFGTELSSEELVKKSDVVFISVPIRETVLVIGELAPLLTKEQAFVDVTSIKGPAVAAMLQSNAEVLGLHPMYGPSIQSMQGQAIVSCSARPGKWTPLLLDLFKKAGANLKEASPEKHDQMMAVIQGLTHFSAISIGLALKKLGIDVEESLEFASPLYKIRLSVAGRILAQDPTLYSDIQFLNPEVRSAVQALASASEELHATLQMNDEGRFEGLFTEAADFLGNFATRAAKESDRLIDEIRKG